MQMNGSSSVFATAPNIPADAIFALTAEYVADEFPDKVNLGQGAYRDETGQPWVTTSVARSREIITTQGLLHEYLPILGLPEFRHRAAELALGREIHAARQSQLATCQTLSGTGALHLAGQIIKSCQSSLPKVYIPEPTWSNHHLIFSTLGYQCHEFQYYDPSTRALDFSSYLFMLNSVDPGSIVILHACAHNPTGLDPTPQQWKEIGGIMKRRQLFPLFDAAYLGFNSGDFEQDAFALRYFIHDLEMESAVCLSFAKNMGLYGERVGCLVLATSTAVVARNSQSVLESIQRSEISNPPAFGARVAATILGDNDLRKLWFQDMKTMSSRIQSMRRLLYDYLVKHNTPGNWNHILEQSGMFGFLGLAPEIVVELKDKYHIYMAANSRISIAGLNAGNVEYVARSIATVLTREQNDSHR
ncbi:hypothetical protein FE257_005744 [Aspergillus nanangensis]|uniref:Aspartate aminotransferase n=1 Tax=Aspergillus nanangensis TaxID=2582783 RepID=A0AAD4CRS9_ASPNN|nr:hypothetical protein FE257_005744 [Aspergillus nanangensis]